MNWNCQFTFCLNEALEMHVCTCVCVCVCVRAHKLLNSCEPNNCSPCGTHMSHIQVCYHGNCEHYSTVIQPVAGQWGAWQSWTSCSLQCGIGVQHPNVSSDRQTNRQGMDKYIRKILLFFKYLVHIIPAYLLLLVHILRQTIILYLRQTDNCLVTLCSRPAFGGAHCLGVRRRHRTCNTQSCPSGSKSYRQQQCEALRRSGRAEDWEAVSDGEGRGERRERAGGGGGEEDRR